MAAGGDGEPGAMALMDEQGAGHPGHPGHPGAQAALDEICNKISDLNKWREIFRFRG